MLLCRYHFERFRLYPVMDFQAVDQQATNAEIHMQHWQALAASPLDALAWKEKGITLEVVPLE